MASWYQSFKLFILRITWASLLAQWKRTRLPMQEMYLLQGRQIPAEGNDNPLQYSCLGNPLQRGAWWSTVHRVTKSRTQLSD